MGSQTQRGQEPVATTLRNAITSDRVHHGYLFTGTRGVGKTSMARILAKALNCLNADAPTIQPCGDCESCRAVAGCFVHHSGANRDSLWN